MDKKFIENSFLFAGNALFVEELFEKYKSNPDSVSSEWQQYFADSSFGENSKLPSWIKKKNSILGVKSPEELAAVKKDSASKPSANITYVNSNFFVEKFRASGHLFANLDPLGIEKKKSIDELGLGEVPENDKDLVSKLTRIYSNNIGFEISHIESNVQKEWLYNKLENSILEDIASDRKKKILTDLIEVEGFEQFLHSRFPGAKRFSVEGGDTTIIAVDEIIRIAVENFETEEVIIGMAHRGRLNMLTKVLEKSYVALLSEFQGNIAHLETLDISGDVKYHLGKSTDKTFKNGKKVHLSLTANPSHLEAVNPVVLGKVRAKQDIMNDKKRSKVMGITLHGDAAFSGQGVVAESLSLGDLEAYKTGGTIHIVTNNQIGFTTNPSAARISRYPTEFAKIIQAPIIHVNGDDPESVIKVALISEEFRQKFQKDVIIDIVCYRRYGHNEGDEPMFSQPKMYKKIKDHKTVATLYSEKLIKEGLITESEFKNQVSAFQKKLDGFYNESKTYKPSKSEWLDGLWSKISQYDKDKQKVEKTGIPLKQLQKIGKALTTYPEKFTINGKLERLIESKIQMFGTGENVDWGTAESLAFGSLLLDKIDIRMTGQDCQRGTFSHRHAVMTDQENESQYIPLNNITEDQSHIEIYNSNLSEFAVLGYEYGYSTVTPDRLTLWEAQFGDFSNGAQIIIDQFISCSEYKWLRMSSLVMLLPHGYEGMGPEHSSARLERYLQLCAEHNMQVVNITTPANYFHALRRQVTDRSFRKPLIVMSPKSLLRHRLVLSRIEEMTESKTFLKVIDETYSSLNKPDKINRVILCSGKVYYDLIEEREKRFIKDIAIVRIEQYYPFPKQELKMVLGKYKNAEVIWCQEEPKNMGAWTFIVHYIEKVLESLDIKAKRPVYIGRINSASPATGYLKIHNKELQEFINSALSNTKL